MADNYRKASKTSAEQRNRSISSRSKTSKAKSKPQRLKVLRIGVIQDAKIVEEKVLRRRETITVGPSEKNSFVLPQSDVHAARFELFETRGGPYALNFTAEMTGRVSLRGKVLDLSDAVAQGYASHQGRHYQLVLDEQARGKVVLGDTTLLFQFVVPPPVQPKPRLPAAVKGSVFAGVELVFSVCLLLSFLIVGGTIAYFELNDWPKPTLEEQFLALQELISADTATFEKKKPTFLEDDEGESEEKEEDETPTPKEEASTKADADEGPKKTEEEIALERATRRAELAEQIAQRGINKILGSLGGDGEGVMTDVLRGGDVGADQDDLLAQVSGVGVASGEVGGSLKGPAGGKGGGEAADISQIKMDGADKTVRTAGPGPERKVSVSVRKKDPIASGGTGMMSSSDVSKVVNRKIGAIKGCYEQALKRDPSLKGKITIRFTISGSGKVTTARPTVNEMNSQVGDCITRAFMRFRFPPPEGGTVTFEYPFLFTPAN